MTTETTPAAETGAETLSPVLRKLHEGLVAAYPGSSRVALTVARQLLADHARELDGGRHVKLAARVRAVLDEFEPRATGDAAPFFAALRYELETWLPESSTAEVTP